MQSSFGSFDCSFLQVTINSNKLLQILERLTKQVNEQYNEVRILREVIPTIKQSVTTQLQTTQSRIKLQLQRNSLKIRQQINIVKSQMQSFETQISKYHIHSEKKFKQKEIQIQHLYEEKKKTEAVIQFCEQNRMENQTKFQKEIEDIKANLSQFSSDFTSFDSKTDEKFQMMFIKFQSILNKNNIRCKNISSVTDEQIKRERFSVISKQKNPLLNVSNWALFSSKIQQFEKNIQKEAESASLMNKVIYSKKPIQKGENEQTGFNNVINDQGQKKLSIHEFNNLFSLQNKENLKQFDSITNKVVILEQKIGINLRKMEKMIQTQSQLKLGIKRIEEKKAQDCWLDLIRSQLRKIQLELLQEMQKKLSKDQFQKEKSKIFDKMVIIQQNFTEKADKADMKKALVFLQQKIKQIIILLANDQNEEKDGALKKIPIKCLSCDKGLQIQNNPSLNNSQVMTSRDNQYQNAKNLNKKIRTKVHTKTIINN